MIRILFLFLLFGNFASAQPFLRNMVGENRGIIVAYGFSYLGDGVEGAFQYSDTSTHLDDSVNYIKPNVVVGAGRWVRVNKKIERITITGTSGIQLTADVTNIDVNAGANATITITPSRIGQVFNIKRVDGNSSYTVTIGMSTGTIDGASTFSEVTQYQSTQFYFDGTNTIVQ